MNMGEEVSHLKAHVNTFYNNGALQRASEQPHLKTNQKPSQINKKVGSQENLGLLVVAGLLVGIGTRLANGCTSGHGVCGISRFSLRWIVATLIYIAAGAVVLALFRHGLGVI
ncbi:YeeE/YedE family protein [Ruegeria sp.]|uniref:YeeE/YedE family protein n=1 Tax=Ruegeria sp. TaxID=1879320 RepID=UPI003B00D2AB